MPMPERYHFDFADNTVYGAVVDLARRFRDQSGEVVVDIGCGFGAIAEPVRDVGLTYLGFDLDPGGLADLEARGFEAAPIDLASVKETIATIEQQLDGRRLAALVMIDALEHITNGPEVLTALRRLAQSQGGASLIIAVPNVTHFDVAAKLLLGRWDMTATGLLDDTHVSFFSPDRLRTVTEAAGWVEVGAQDFELPMSDQHFPADAAVLQGGTPLHDLLHDVRSRALGSVIVNEFARAYAPLSLPDRSEDTVTEAPFLSVLMRTQGTRPATLQDALLSLAAQSSQDFEVLLLPHDIPREDVTHLRYLADAFGQQFSDRVRIIPVDGGGRTRPLTVGIEAARGRYVAILDDDDVVFGHWLSTFEQLAAKHPGRVLRSPTAQQDVQPTLWGGVRPGYEIAGRPRCRWPEPFEVLDHLYENHSPPCGYALPRSIFAEQGLRFDETLPVLEDWDVLMHAVLWCGVADSGDITSLWRRWRTGDSSTSVHTEYEWIRSRAAVLAKLDARPLLLPARSVTALNELHEQILALTDERDHLRRIYAAQSNHLHHVQHAATIVDNYLVAVKSSTSWKLAKPVRVIGDLVRRLLGKKPALEELR
jgi:2-polyprenyl-3-methyl-5-hydroxy-6-metoxy-1,4-benzoquinol methylase